VAFAHQLVSGGITRFDVVNADNALFCSDSGFGFGPDSFDVFVWRAKVALRWVTATTPARAGRASSWERQNHQRPFSRSPGGICGVFDWVGLGRGTLAHPLGDPARWRTDSLEVHGHAASESDFNADRRRLGQSPPHPGCLLELRDHGHACRSASSLQRAVPIT
jgi:hypothetical protein